MKGYKAVCGACGEIYLFKSEHDDLEGLVLSCKKAQCSGKVAVEVEFETKGPVELVSRQTRFH